jgi:hypothetical protein
MTMVNIKEQNLLKKAKAMHDKAVEGDDVIAKTSVEEIARVLGAIERRLKPKPSKKQEKLMVNTTNYTLGNGEEYHSKSPKIFWIPERSDREALGPGDMVKCVFEAPEGSEAGGERMWVLVKEVRDDGTYRGELNSHPIIINAKTGDEVLFGPEHVIDID